MEAKIELGVGISVRKTKKKLAGLSPMWDFDIFNINKKKKGGKKLI